MRISAILLATLSVLSGKAQMIDRTKPPETAPLPAYHLPPVFETKLSNGLTVVLLDDNRFPLVTVRLAFAAGSRFDPKDLRGLAEATGSLLAEGTSRRTSRQIAEEATSIGGAINAQTSPDTLTISASALAEHANELLDLVADVARNATFPADEVKLYQQNRKQRLIEQRSRSEFLAQEKFEEIIFGANPYGRTTPTAESIDKLDIPTLVRFRNSYLVPNNGVLIALGNLPARGDLLKTLQKQFGDWKSHPVPPVDMPAIPGPHKNITLVDRPGSVQADVHIGRVGVPRTSPDYFPLVVGNTILGGGASSRLFNDIREKQGYAYSVYSHLTPLKDAGVFGAGMQVRNEVAGPAISSMLSEMNGMAKERVLASELTDVKNYLSGVFVLRLQTQDGLASQLAVVRAIGLPLDYLEKYTTRIRSVEPDQIQSVAKKIIAPDESAIVVVGDAGQIRPALEKFGKVNVITEK